MDDRPCLKQDAKAAAARSFMVGLVEAHGRLDPLATADVTSLSPDEALFLRALAENAFIIDRSLPVTPAVRNETVFLYRRLWNVLINMEQALPGVISDECYARKGPVTPCYLGIALNMFVADARRIYERGGMPVYRHAMDWDHYGRPRSGHTLVSDVIECAVRHFDSALKARKPWPAELWTPHLSARWHDIIPPPIGPFLRQDGLVFFGVINSLGPWQRRKILLWSENRRVAAGARVRIRNGCPAIGRPAHIARDAERLWAFLFPGITLSPHCRLDAWREKWVRLVLVMHWIADHRAPALLGLSTYESLYRLPWVTISKFARLSTFWFTPRTNQTPCYGAFLGARDLYALLEHAPRLYDMLYRVARPDTLEKRAALALAERLGNSLDVTVWEALNEATRRLVALYLVQRLVREANMSDSSLLHVVARALDIDPDRSDYADSDGVRRLCADIVLASLPAP